MKYFSGYCFARLIIISFENIPAGTYIVYAPNAQGKTVFEHVTISGNRNKLTLNEMIKDPFVP